MTDYYGIFLNGFATGFGVILANHVWNTWIEHRAKNFHENIKKVNNMITGKKE